MFTSHLFWAMAIWVFSTAMCALSYWGGYSFGAFRKERTIQQRIERAYYETHSVETTGVHPQFPQDPIEFAVRSVRDN